MSRLNVKIKPPSSARAIKHCLQIKNAHHLHTTTQVDLKGAESLPGPLPLCSHHVNFLCQSLVLSIHCPPVIPGHLYAREPGCISDTALDLSASLPVSRKKSSVRKMLNHNYFLQPNCHLLNLPCSNATFQPFKTPVKRCFFR